MLSELMYKDQILYYIIRNMYALDIHHYNAQTYEQTSNLSIILTFLKYEIAIHHYVAQTYVQTSNLSVILHDINIQGTFSIIMCILMHTNLISV